MISALLEFSSGRFVALLQRSPWQSSWKKVSLLSDLIPGSLPYKRRNELFRRLGSYLNQSNRGLDHFRSWMESSFCELRKPARLQVGEQPMYLHNHYQHMLDMVHCDLQRHGNLDDQYVRYSLKIICLCLVFWTRHVVYLSILQLVIYKSPLADDDRLTIIAYNL